MCFQNSPFGTIHGNVPFLFLITEWCPLHGCSTFALFIHLSVSPWVVSPFVYCEQRCSNTSELVQDPDFRFLSPFLGRGLSDLKFPDQGLNLDPQQCKRRVLTPREVPDQFFLILSNGTSERPPSSLPPRLHYFTRAPDPPGPHQHLLVSLFLS